MDSIPSRSGADHLVIICPKCAERFQVDPSFMGRIAECGECRHEFTITDKVIEKHAKFYPGEKRDPLLKQVARISTPLPMASDPNVPDSFGSQSTPVIIGPPSPQRILLVVLAVFIVLISLLIMTFGRAPGGVLDGMSIFKQFVMAGFVTTMASLMLVAAGPGRRIRMLLIGLALGGTLLAIPLSEWLRSLKDDRAPIAIGPQGGSPTAVDNPQMPDLDELRELIVTKPLDDERERLRKANSTKQALGLWLRDLHIRNARLVKDYIVRETHAAEESHPYPRGDHDYLMVVTGISCSLDELAAFAGALGKEVTIHRELGIVEVKVENKRFAAGPIDQMTDPENPKFYLLNRIELESIDTERIATAVRRLAPVEPKLFQPDISKRLLDLLGKDWVEDKAEVCKALMTWSGEDQSEVATVALQQARLLHEAGKEVPVEMIALAVRRPSQELLSELVKLWLKDASRWEQWIVRCGPLGEEEMVRQLPGAQGSMRHSVVRILGRIGSVDVVPVLEAESKSTQDAEMKVLARKAIEQIRGKH